jgi:hypothetical protein
MTTVLVRVLLVTKSINRYFLPLYSVAIMTWLCRRRVAIANSNAPFVSSRTLPAEAFHPIRIAIFRIPGTSFSPTEGSDFRRCSTLVMTKVMHSAGKRMPSVAPPDETGCQYFPISVMDAMEGADWTNRLNFQAKWSNKDKGWQVAVEWKNTPFGVGLFAAQDITDGTIIRIGKNGFNLVQFQGVLDIESFCNEGQGDAEHHARLHYVSDYLWGYSYKNTDSRGYDIEPLEDKDSIEDRFFGMWIPGNGLNHKPTPNTVYRTRKGGTEDGIVLVALGDITKGDELYDDYRRHGRAPQWLLDFSKAKQVSLNFAECNDFVEPDESEPQI